MSHQAGCLCGAVRIAIDAEPIATRQCWCRLCQYLAAGNATINTVFPSDKVAWTGDVAWYASVADSGRPMERGFCPACGTPLFSRTNARPHLLIVRTGALDDPELQAPSMHIWTAEAPGWACLDPALPQVEGQPPPVA